MGSLDGRVVIVTGAGRGLGREHALLLAAEGASVVVNDLGGSLHGTGQDAGPAAQVVAEIRACGGTAVANTDDVADWKAAGALVDHAIDAFGGLDVLVNNAGIVRDSMLVNMTEAMWDSVVNVNLKGHAAPLHWAAKYWRTRSKGGDPVAASVINTSSVGGLVGNVGQSNYGAAKAAVAALTIIAAQEFDRYGVRCNAIVPAARTRFTESSPRLVEKVALPEDPDAFDSWAPGNVSPLVACLAAADCEAQGQVFFARGGLVGVMEPWRPGKQIASDGRWPVPELAREIKRLPLAGQRHRVF